MSKFAVKGGTSMSRSKKFGQLGDEDSYSSSLGSGGSTALSYVYTKSKKIVIGVGVWTKWTTTSDFFLFTTAFDVHSYFFNILLKYIHAKDAENSPNILHFIMVILVYGLPMIYMQLSVGQYNQKALICIKEMCPIIHGTAYTALLIMFMHAAEVAVTMSIFVIYALSSMSNHLQWLECPKDVTDCWNTESDCHGDCLRLGYPSALKYFNVIHLGKKQTADPNWTWLLMKFLPLATSWCIIILCLAFLRITYKKLVAILFYASITFAVALFVGCICTENGLEFTKHFVDIRWQQFVSFKAWGKAFFDTYHVIALGKGLHVVTGTFLGPKSHSGLLAIGSAGIPFLILIFMNCLSLSSYEILKHCAHGTEERWKRFWTFSLDETVYGIIPQAIGCIGVSTFWSLIYFFSCLFMDMNCIMVHIILIEKCFTDANLKLQKYRVYTTLIIVTLIFLMATIAYRTIDSYRVFLSIFLAARLAELINMTIIISTICILYGIQKLCDDVHFMTGSSPTRCWKILWYLMPMLCAIFLVISIIEVMKIPMRNKFMPQSDVVGISIFVYLSPIAIFGSVKIWRYIRKKNLVLLFKPTEFYGSNDPEERHLRTVHNPRTEIRSRRKNDSCSHRCFINNRAFRKAVRLQEEARDKIVGSQEALERKGAEGEEEDD